MAARVRVPYAHPTRHSADPVPHLEPLMDPDDIPTEITKLAYSDPTGASMSQNRAARMLAHYWPAIEAHIREQVAAERLADLREQIAQQIAPSPEHAAVYLDDEDNLWVDYPTSPPSDSVLPLVWASEECESRSGLESQGRRLRVIGWSR